METEPYSKARAAAMEMLDLDYRISDHARDKMEDYDMIEEDVHNVILGGKCNEIRIESGTWRYRMATNVMSVVVSFTPE